MRLPLLILAFFVLALGACNKGGVEAKDESAESVAKKVRDSIIKPNPGRWQITTKIEKLEMSGMTPHMQEQLNHSPGMTTQKNFFCLTPAEANQPDVFFYVTGSSGCIYKHFIMASGQVNALETCTSGGTQMHRRIQGTYSANSYDVHITGHGDTASGNTRMIMALEKHWVGECNGTEMK